MLSRDGKLYMIKDDALFTTRHSCEPKGQLMLMFALADTSLLIKGLVTFVFNSIKTLLREVSTSELLKAQLSLLVLGIASLRSLQASGAILLSLVSNGTELLLNMYSENSEKRAFSELCESIALVTICDILLIVLVIMFDTLLVKGVMICDKLILMMLWVSWMEVTLFESCDILDK